MQTATVYPVGTLNPMLPQPCFIRRVLNDTYDTFTLELDPVIGHPFHFAPGQFNMLYAFGVGEVPVSISGDPKHPETLIHTIREVGTVTRAIRKLRPGSLIGVRGPFGSSWPVEKAEKSDVVIVAGGIGLPPLRPAIYHILANREKYGRVILLYGARTPQDLLYTKELERWRSRLDVEVSVTVDTAAADWKGNVGVVTTLIPREEFDPAHTIAMIVGPEIMMRFTIMDLQKRGIPSPNIYLSMERNMKCAVGLCGHCQLGSSFICKDGPVFSFDQLSDLFGKREI
jgi:NAD(P)H-flavin reductase